MINNTGVLEANTVGTQAGKIVLGAATAASKPAAAPTQTVKVSGTVSASGRSTGGKGGTIQVTGENIQVTAATIDASGDSGGGKVLIGGDWGGGHPTTQVSNPSAQLETSTIPTATTVSVDAATTIGTWTPSASGSTISNTDLVAQLGTSNVIISTGLAGSPGSDAGTITVNAPVSWNSANSLTLNAHSDININAAITNTNTTGASVFLSVANRRHQRQRSGDLEQHRVSDAQRV